MPVIQEEYWELDSILKRAPRIDENILYHERQQEQHMFLFVMEEEEGCAVSFYTYLETEVFLTGSPKQQRCLKILWRNPN